MLQRRHEPRLPHRHELPSSFLDKVDICLPLDTSFSCLSVDNSSLNQHPFGVRLFIFGGNLNNSSFIESNCIQTSIATLDSTILLHCPIAFRLALRFYLFFSLLFKEFGGSREEQPRVRRRLCPATWGIRGV
jgi:hypothetical protein